MFLTCVSVGLCPTSFKIRNLLWCFENKALKEKTDVTGKLFQETCKGPLEPQAVKWVYFCLFWVSALLNWSSHILLTQFHGMWVYLNWMKSEVEIRLELFWAYIRIDKIMSESNSRLLKPKILFADINSIFPQTLLILPGIRMHWAINQGSVVYMPIFIKYKLLVRNLQGQNFLIYEDAEWLSQDGI